MKVKIEATVVKNKDNTYSARINTNFTSSQENVKKADSLAEISAKIQELLQRADEKGLITIK